MSRTINCLQVITQKLNVRIFLNILFEEFLLEEWMSFDFSRICHLTQPQSMITTQNILKIGDSITTITTSITCQGKTAYLKISALKDMKIISVFV